MHAAVAVGGRRRDVTCARLSLRPQCAYSAKKNERDIRVLGAVSAGLERGHVPSAQHLWDGIVRSAVRDQCSVLDSLWRHHICHVRLEKWVEFGNLLKLYQLLHAVYLYNTDISESTSRVQISDPIEGAPSYYIPWYRST